MITSLSRRLAALALIGVFALIAAACGSDANTSAETADEVSDDAASDEAMSDEGMSDEAMSDEDMEAMADEEHSGHDTDSDDSGDKHSDEHGGDHDHGSMLEVEAATAPTVEIDVIADPKSGYNVRVVTTDFSVSPQNASTEHVDGEGHMHLLIDGVKQGRFYNEWIHVGGLEAGEHSIEVELNANTHAPYAVEGERIADSETVMVGESAGHQHGDDATVAADGETVSIEAFADPLGGWNVQISTTNFTIAPENASTEHVDGEGHMHLLIDGVKQGRIYGEWIYVPGQGPGEHTIDVELSANDHRPYAIDDEPVRGSVVVTGTDQADTDQAGTDQAGTDADPAAEDAVMVMVTVADGDVTIDTNGSDSDRVEVPLGSSVRLMITSDVVEHIHVHGYDLFADLTPGETAVLDFVAEIPGLVEVELEDSGTFLFELISQ